MDIEQLKELIRNTPNDSELGKKLRSWYHSLTESDTKIRWVNPYNGKVEN